MNVVVFKKHFKECYGYAVNYFFSNSLTVAVKCNDFEKPASSYFNKWKYACRILEKATG